jgi:hypothetical protein
MITRLHEEPNIRMREVISQLIPLYWTNCKGRKTSTKGKKRKLKHSIMEVTYGQVFGDWKRKFLTLQTFTVKFCMVRSSYKGMVKAKISLLQAVEAPRVARGRGSHIT